MKTELELIYTIHNIVRGGEYNADDAINERLMRQFLSAHRGKLLDQAYKNGALLPEESFQEIGEVPFLLNTKGEYASNVLPKIIRFEKGYYGIIASKHDYVIPVLNSEEFQNASKDKFNKFHPRLKFINEKLILNIGMSQCGSNFTESELNTIVDIFENEKNINSLKLDISAVLVNTDDSPSYDWTSSPYPLSDELIESMMNSVNAREFNLFLKVRSDETGDSRRITSQESQDV